MADDPVASDPAATRTGVLILWGQIPFDGDVAAPRDWSGALSVNRGALLVRRVLRFEDATDGIVPRTDVTAVEFSSFTQPHHDGLALEIIAPSSDEPVVLTYSGTDGTVIDLPLADLLAGPVSHEVDTAGNRLVAAGIARPLDPCLHGFLRGRWHRVAGTRGGLILGAVVGPLGAPIGYMLGVYGVKVSGEPVFFAKVIGLGGRFLGLLGGVYGDGQFVGRWIDRSGDLGVLSGHYRESDATPGVGGHYLGRWAERTCAEAPAP